MAAAAGNTRAGVNPNEVASLFTSQVAAALQFEMEEVFAMTSEGLRGRLLMLQHATAQGFAPSNAHKLIMFLNLELQERAAGRIIELSAEDDSAPRAPPPLPPQAPKPSVSAGGGGGGVVKQAPAFAWSSSVVAAVRASSAAHKSVPSAKPPAPAATARLETGSDGGSTTLRDRPWNRKKKSGTSEAFSIGENGRMEVCFITSGASNKRKPPKKKPADSTDAVPKAAKTVSRESSTQSAASTSKVDADEERKKALRRITEHKAKQQQPTPQEPERTRRPSASAGGADAGGIKGQVISNLKLSLKTSSESDKSSSKSKSKLNHGYGPTRSNEDRSNEDTPTAAKPRSAPAPPQVMSARSPASGGTSRHHLVIGEGNSNATVPTPQASASARVPRPAAADDKGGDKTGAASGAAKGATVASKSVVRPVSKSSSAPPASYEPSQPAHAEDPVEELEEADEGQSSIHCELLQQLQAADADDAEHHHTTHTPAAGRENGGGQEEGGNREGATHVSRAQAPLDDQGQEELSVEEVLDAEVDDVDLDAVRVDDGEELPDVGAKEVDTDDEVSADDDEVSADDAMSPHPHQPLPHHAQAGEAAEAEAESNGASEAKMLVAPERMPSTASCVSDTISEQAEQVTEDRERHYDALDTPQHHVHAASEPCRTECQERGMPLMRASPQSARSPQTRRDEQDGGRQASVEQSCWSAPARSPRNLPPHVTHTVLVKPDDRPVDGGPKGEDTAEVALDDRWKHQLTSDTSLPTHPTHTCLAPSPPLYFVFSLTSKRPAVFF